MNQSLYNCQDCGRPARVIKTQVKGGVVYSIICSTPTVYDCRLALLFAEKPTLKEASIEWNEIMRSKYPQRSLPSASQSHL